jgi:4-hydroxybenzoate polyprenyltransferase
VVFVGLVFSMNLGEFRYWLAAITAFVVFCALSSAVYLVNDILDREHDRHHSKKRNRAIASGRLGVSLATAIALTLMAGGIIGAFLINRISAIPGSPAINYHFAAVAIAFLVLNLLYSFVLKHMVLIDVFSIAAGFVLRAVGGVLIIWHENGYIMISSWLIVCTFLIALFLALNKRRSELRSAGAAAQNQRKTLDRYTPALLDQLILIVTAMVLVSYMMYTFLGAAHGSRTLIVTIPFAVYGVFRYLMLVESRGIGEETEAVFRDIPLILDMLLWVLAVIVLFYFNDQVLALVPGYG